MGDLKYFAHKSGWVAFKSKMFWLFTIIGIALIYGLRALEFEQWYLGFLPLLVALIVLTCKIVILHCYRLYFYDAHVLVKHGVFRREEDNFAFLGVLEVNIRQTFFGRIFRVGNVNINFVGENRIDKTTIPNISKPRKLKKYLEIRLSKEDEMAKVVI